MKTKLFLIAVVVAFTFANSQALTTSEKNDNDSTPHRIDIRVNQDNMVVFRADKLEGQKRLSYILKVYSQEGEMIYASTFLKKKPIYKTFSLADLPDGTYQFKVYERLKPIYTKEIVKGSSPVISTGGEQLLVEEL